MPTITTKLNNPTLTVALTQAELATAGVSVECQANTVLVDSAPVSTTTAATGCRPPTQSAGPSSWSLNLTILQDWNDPLGICQFSLDNDGATVFYEFEPDPAVYPGLKFVGTCDVVAFGIGGNVGDGTEVNSQKVWPVKEKPTITRTATLAADDLAA